MAGVVAEDGDDTQRFQCFPLTGCIQLQLVVIVFPSHRGSLSLCFPLIVFPTSTSSAIVNIVIVLPFHDYKFFTKSQNQHFHCISLQPLWQYFHCVSLSPASFLPWATPPSTCSVLTSRELRFRLKSLKTRARSCGTWDGYKITHFYLNICILTISRF